MAEVKSTYVRPSDDELLKRCLDKMAQNQNESLNEMIWDRIPKGVFLGQDILALDANDAVSHFNIASQAAKNVLEMQGVEPGKYCCKAMTRADILRISKGECKAEENNKLQENNCGRPKERKMTQQRPMRKLFMLQGNSKQLNSTIIKYWWYPPDLGQLFFAIS